MKQSIGARTLVYPTPAFVVCTYDQEGKPNAATVAWSGICCSNPPCIAVSLRKATYTYHNIIDKKNFTVNIPSERFVREVDYFGIASGKKEDKFVISGLTPVKSSIVDAPYIEEFPLILECKLFHTIELGLHTQFIGEIVDVKADDSILGKGGFPDIERLLPVVYTPEVRTYYGIGKPLGKAFSMGKTLMRKKTGTEK